MAKLVRVRAVNFRSFDNLDLSLGDFTVIVGENDLGKSNFLKAVFTVLTNPRGTSAIRRGAKSLEVILDFIDPELQIHYMKGKSAHYTVTRGGKSHSYDKMGSDVPPEVLELVKPWIVEGLKPLVVQIKQQHDPIFILGESSSTAKTNLLDNIEGRIFQQAVTTCESHLRKLNRSQTQLIKDDAEWAVKLESLSEVLPIAVEFKRLRNESLLMAMLLFDFYKQSLLLIKKKFNGLCLVLARSFQSKLTTLIEDVKGLRSESDFLSYLISSIKLRRLQEELMIQQQEKDDVDRRLFESGYCPLCGQVVGSC